MRRIAEDRITVGLALIVCSFAVLVVTVVTGFFGFDRCPQPSVGTVEAIGLACASMLAGALCFPDFPTRGRRVALIVLTVGPIAAVTVAIAVRQAGIICEGPFG
jgi:hypothetical protein